MIVNTEVDCAIRLLVNLYIASSIARWGHEITIGCCRAVRMLVFLG